MRRWRRGPHAPMSKPVRHVLEGVAVWVEVDTASIVKQGVEHDFNLLGGNPRSLRVCPQMHLIALVGLQAAKITGE